MITNLTIFTSSICNLDCSYCYVKKSHALFEYDGHIINSIKNNEYINRFKKDFPQYLNTLTTLEFWGAEPTIHLDLVAEKLIDYKDAFPNLSNISLSSNYTLPEFIDKVKALVMAMGSIKETTWNLHIQCSIDVSPYITNNNRGNGTTNKIISNINRLKDLFIPQNVQLTVSNKSTISNDQFDYLTDLNNVENYIAFLHDVIDYKSRNKTFWISAPTCVEPFYYTKLDGLKFSKVIDNFICISEKNENTFIPYVRNKKINLSEYMCGGFCGQCDSCVTMLPDNMYSACHRCGFDIIPEHYDMKNIEYHKMFNRNLEDKSSWITDLKNYNQLTNNMNIFYSSTNKMIFTQLYNISKVLLDVGEISPMYYNDKLLKQHIMLFMHFTKCIQTNKELTGSYFCCSSFFIPLFFNGAIDKIYNYLLSKNKLVK